MARDKYKAFRRKKANVIMWNGQLCLVHRFCPTHCGHGVKPKLFDEAFRRSILQAKGFDTNNVTREKDGFELVYSEPVELPMEKEASWLSTLRS